MALSALTVLEGIDIDKAARPLQVHLRSLGCDMEEDSREEDNPEEDSREEEDNLEQDSLEEHNLEGVQLELAVRPLQVQLLLLALNQP